MGRLSWRPHPHPHPPPPGFRCLNCSGAQIPRPFVGKKTPSSPVAPASAAAPMQASHPCRFPSLQAPILAGSRPCKLPWRAADASSNPTCQTAQGLTINYNLVMFGAKTIGGDDLINFGMTYLPRRGNPPGLFCTPVRGGRHPRHAHLGRACRAQRRIKPTAATRKRESA